MTTDVAPVLARVSEVALDVAEHEAFVTNTSAGAHVVFCGVVRARDGGRDVLRLDYEAHPNAEQMLREIAAEFVAHSEVTALAVSHRTGVLAVGDVALVAAVATAHRREAFEVCAQLVEAVKHRLPVWKHQYFADGTDEWVNCP